jgi:hypothetical protein
MMVWTWCGWEPLQYYRPLGGFHEQQEVLMNDSE